ncbi:MAG: co-chaperone GroES [Candidatus Scatovivens sp.]
MLKPLPNKVLLKLKESKEKTKSGIIVTNNIKENVQTAEIISIGKITDECYEGLKEGNLVIFNKYSGIEISYNGKEYLIVNNSDILAVIEK